MPVYIVSEELEGLEGVLVCAFLKTIAFDFEVLIEMRQRVNHFLSFFKYFWNDALTFCGVCWLSGGIVRKETDVDQWRLID
ncbi:hypothetical protein TNCV_3832561 [Trichonephila clavipes]|nr:hypothetical protein TNCV_3832561 [Trichonephila clavipes]